MSLVGDVIMSARELFPDMPTQTVSAPGSELVYAAVSTPAGETSLPAGNNYIKATYLNPWGETTAGSEQTVNLTAGQTVKITGTLPAGATGLRAYQAVSAGGENQWFYSTTLPFTIDATSPSPGKPPSSNSAFLPDSDGSMVSSATVYRWLNEAFDKSGLMSNGIKDQTGVAMVQGVGIYTLPGRWRKINNCWYQGWLMSRQSTLNFYYHNAATGIAWMLDVTSVRNNNLVLELWPQANTSSSSTTLSSSMAVSDVSASVVNASGFLTPGIGQIGTEVVAFSTASSTSVKGILRGLGGTAAQAWSSGATFQAFDLRIQGTRLPNKNSIGDAYKTIDLPMGAESIFPDYLVSKFRDAEQDRATAKSLRDDFEARIKDLIRSNRQISGPVQIGGAARETYGSGWGGGWFLP